MTVNRRPDAQAGQTTSDAQITRARAGTTLVKLFAGHVGAPSCRRSKASWPDRCVPQDWGGEVRMRLQSAIRQFAASPFRREPQRVIPSLRCRRFFKQPRPAIDSRQAELVMVVSDIVPQPGISEQTFYRWKKQCAGMQVLTCTSLSSAKRPAQRQPGLQTDILSSKGRANPGGSLPSRANTV
jgi:hypothetical protein